ncbi:hypothetical protein O181_076553 [Austropuccinia psidii MF-1]|uniref:Uncharacterized protein n=1 Tax=Austropuccinia psidii MF-1 TaxID=1389203 RepID=A0A9Q3FB23_9BASI|nr:hypothetical protein [Austropuccinia psidii MF-1]
MIKQRLNGKFDEAGSQGILLGYRETHQYYWFMDSGTGNVKISHYAELLPTEFPLLKAGVNSDDNHSFILVPNETETLPIENDIISNDPNIPLDSERSHKSLQDPQLKTHL